MVRVGLDMFPCLGGGIIASLDLDLCRVGLDIFPALGTSNSRLNNPLVWLSLDILPALGRILTCRNFVIVGLDMFPRLCSVIPSLDLFSVGLDIFPAFSRVLASLDLGLGLVRVGLDVFPGFGGVITLGHGVVVICLDVLPGLGGGYKFVSQTKCGMENEVPENVPGRAEAPSARKAAMDTSCWRRILLVYLFVWEFGCK